jgi:hypothetical protein
VSETDRTDFEIAALRELISRASRSVPSAHEPGDFKELLGAIAGYTWSDEEHRVVYECLRSARRRPVVPLREEMAAEATRMGHPDVDWDLYFQPSASGTYLPELVRRLKNNS